MNAHKLTGFMAIACILASIPIGLLKYPWLPATVMEFVQLWRGPIPAWATESFRTWREARLHHLELALTLYALGTATLGALGAVAAKILPAWAELVVWIVAAGTALEVSIFERPYISATTDPTYTFIMVRVTLTIAVVATVAALISLGNTRSSMQPKHRQTL